MSMIDVSRLPDTVPTLVRAFATRGAMRSVRPEYGSRKGRGGRSSAEVMDVLMRVVAEEQEQTQ